MSQFLIQQLVLLLELFNQAHLGVLVLDGLIRYVAGLARVLKGVDVFFDVQVARVQARDHQAVRVPAQTVPQEGSQFGFTVRDILLGLLLLVGESCYDLSKGEKTFVDIDRFLVCLVASESLPLTTS